MTEPPQVPAAEIATAAFLAESGVVEFDFKPKLALTKIDRKASFNNQARLYGPINEDKALTMGIWMEQYPETVPAIVTCSRNGKHEILGGNHRYFCAMDILGWRTLAAFVITQDMTDDHKRLIATTDNIRNGDGSSLEERIVNAAWAVHNHTDMTIRKAALLYQIPERRLQGKLARDEIAMRLDELGLKRWRQKIKSQNSLERLRPLRDDDVLSAMVKLIAETSMKTDEVSDLVTKVNKLRSTSTQLGLIEEVAQRYRPEIRASAGGKLPIPRILSNIKSICGRIDRIDLDDLIDLSAEQGLRESVRERVIGAAARLNEVASRL